MNSLLIGCALVGWLLAWHLARQVVVERTRAERLRAQYVDAVHTVSHQARTLHSYRQRARSQITILDEDGNVTRPYVLARSPYSLN